MSVDQFVAPSLELKSQDGGEGGVTTKLEMIKLEIEIEVSVVGNCAKTSMV